MRNTHHSTSTAVTETTMAESASAVVASRAAIAAGTSTTAAAPSASSCTRADQKVLPGGAVHGLARICGNTGLRMLRCERQHGSFHGRPAGRISRAATATFTPQKAWHCISVAAGAKCSSSNAICPADGMQPHMSWMRLLRQEFGWR